MKMKQYLLACSEISQLTNTVTCLYPPFSFTDVQFSSLWHGQAGSFLGDPSSMSLSTQHSPPLLKFDEPTSVQQQTDYLRRLTENPTEENFHVEGIGQSTQLSMSPDQMGRIMEAIRQGQEFPPNSTSLNSSAGFFESPRNTEVWSSSSALSVGDTSATLGMVSDDPSFFVAPTLNSQFSHSQHMVVTSAGIVTSSKLVTGGGDYAPLYGVTQDIGNINSCPQQGVSSDLAGINPSFNAGTEIDINRYLRIPDVEVTFCDLVNRFFEKQQSRKDKQARQRIINGKVKFLVRSERQVTTVKAWVRREVKAAKLEKDINGEVQIEAVFLRKLKDSGKVSITANNIISVKITVLFEWRCESPPFKWRLHVLSISTLYFIVLFANEYSRAKL